MERAAEVAVEAGPAPVSPPDFAVLAAIRDPEERGRILRAFDLAWMDNSPRSKLEWKDQRFIRIRWETGDCAHFGCRGSAVFCEWVSDQIAGWRETTRFVLVKNSTPEPDGSEKWYALRIPPGFTWRPCAAIAYTFGRHAHGWYPQQET